MFFIAFSRMSIFDPPQKIADSPRFIARSAIYVHRRSLLLVPTPPPTTPPPVFPTVIGLIIIGETVACTLRVIFCGDFKVPKKPEKKSAFSPLLGSQATARLTPILGTLLDTFLRFF